MKVKASYKGDAMMTIYFKFYGKFVTNYCKDNYRNMKIPLTKAASNLKISNKVTDGQKLAFLKIA